MTINNMLGLFTGEFQSRSKLEYPIMISCTVSLWGCSVSGSVF